MKGALKQAKKTNGRRYDCDKCQFKLRGLGCEVCRICTDSYIKGFLNGSKWTEKELKKQQEITK